MSPSNSIDIISIALIVVVLANSLLGFLVYFNNKEKARLNKHYFFLALAIDAWVLSMFLFRTATEPDQVLLFSKFLYGTFTFVPLTFFNFTASFFEKRVKKTKQIFVTSFFAVSAILAFAPNLLITGVEPRIGAENAIFFGLVPSIIYSSFATVVIGFGYLYLLQFYAQNKDTKTKKQALFIIIGTLAAALTGFVTNLVLPFFGIFALNWMSQITVMVMVVVIAVAILRYQLFNLKLILTQVLVFAIWIISFYQLLSVARTVADITIGIGSFVFTVAVGLLLIRSVNKEIEQRQDVEKLSTKLQEVNKELQKLDELKTEFLSLASHQLRTPLTSIKGYSSMILEGSFGKITKRVHEPVRRIFESSSILAKIITDLLDVSKIEQGGLQYEMITFSLASMVQSVVDEQKINAKQKGIRLDFEMKQPGRYALKGDQVKLRQVVVNLVDNAIKYTDRGGEINVILQKRQKEDKKYIELTVADNGKGITKETIAKLFQKFSRGDAGKKTNTGGSGLGLYLAKQIVKAHAGELRIESEGLGKGSQFIAEFQQEY